MTSISRDYSLHGIGLTVKSESPVLADCVDAILGPFAGGTGCRRPVLIRLAHGEPPEGKELEGLSLIGRTPFGADREVKVFADAHRRVTELAGMAWISLNLRQRQVEMIIRPGEEWCFEPGCLMPMFCDLLAREKHQVFHAATLAAETVTGHRAVILAGVSGVGKTTTSLALARAGLRLLTDDASFLVRRDGALKIWGFPRPCKVHRRTLAMLDWIGELEKDPRWRADEFTLDLNRIRPCDPKLEVAPGLLILLMPRNDREHRVEEIDKLIAMSEMTRQNVRTAQGFAVESASRSFETLGQLVTASRTLRLSVGPNLPTLAGVLQSWLEK